MTTQLISQSREKLISFLKKVVCVSHTSSVCAIDETDTIDVSTTRKGVNWEICLPLTDTEAQGGGKRKSPEKSYILSMTQFLSLIANEENEELEVSFDRSKQDSYDFPEDVSAFCERGCGHIHNIVFQILLSFSQKKVLNKALAELLQEVSKPTT